MANGVSVKISTKYDGKGIKQAQNGMKSLTSVAKNLNMAVGGFVVAKVFQGISKVVNGATQVFKEDNEAQTKLFTSLSNNSKIAKKDIETFSKEISKMSGLFSGSELQTSASLLSNLGLDKQQMTETLNVAQDLASAGVMPLEQASKALGQSYSGNIGQLKKMCPELSNLTKEQLKNGEAVKILKEKYDGFSDIMKNSFSGREKIFQDQFSQLQSNIGEIIQSAKFMAQGSLLEPLKNVTNFIEQNKTKIISIIAHLPELFSIAWDSIKKIVTKTFTGDGLTNLFSFLGKLLVENVRLSLNSIWAIVKALATMVSELYEATLGKLFTKIGNWIGEMGNKLIETLNVAFQKVLSVPGIKQLYEWLSGNKIADVQLVKFRFETDKKVSDKTLVQALDNGLQAFKEAGNTVSDGLKKYKDEQSKNLTKFTSFYSAENKELMERFSEIVNSDLPDDLKQALTSSIETLQQKENNNSGSSLGGEIDLGPWKDLLSCLGQLGTAIQLIMSSNWIGLIIQLIISLVGDIQEKSEAFKRFLNCFDELADKINNSGIVEAFDKMFTPLLGILCKLGEYIGQILEPIFSVLGEVIGFVAQFVGRLLVCLGPLIQFVSTIINILLQSLLPVLNILEPFLVVIGEVIATLYNYVLRPVLNGIIIILDTIQNVFVAVWNVIADIINGLTFGLAKMKRAKYNNYSNLLDKTNFDVNLDVGKEYLEPSITTNNTSSASNSASYTAAKDVYVTINFNSSFVNGDAREIAIKLKEEIISAEKLGY